MAHPLNPLSLLEELQRSGSLHAAGSRLDRTPSALSKMLRALERQVGVPLVEHNSKPLRLTDAGRAYAEAGRKMAEALSVAADFSAALTRQLGGSLRITASYLLGHMVLADYLVRFRRQHPQLRVDVVLSDEDLDPIEHQFDVALRHEPGARNELIGRALGANRVRLCGSVAYFERHGRPTTPAELERHVGLVFRCEPLDARWHFRRGAEQCCVVPQGGLSANSDELLMASLRAGDGLLPCFDWVVGPELAAGTLQSCLDDWAFSSPAFGASELWAVYPRSKRGRPKIQAFLDGLSAHLAQLAGAAGAGR